MTPTGAPTARAAIIVAIDCTHTVARTWAMVKPSVWSTLSSRRRARTDAHEAKPECDGAEDGEHGRNGDRNRASRRRVDDLDREQRFRQGHPSGALACRATRGARRSRRSVASSAPSRSSTPMKVAKPATSSWR